MQDARSNIPRHYDLSNELFALFLDETMTYSSAWFEPGRRPAPTPSAARSTASWTSPASGRARTCWRSAPAGARSPSGPRERGARVTTLTISAEQQALARQRADAGRRRPTGSTCSCGLPRGAGQLRRDRVSVEMIEAVGEAYWPDLLRHARPAARARRPGRAAGDHHAARPDAGHPRQLHLDPQVHLPRRAHPVGAGRSTTTCAAHTGLRIVERRDLGAALRAHAGALAGAVPRPTGTEVAALGFDDTFRRMWEFYLAYCEAGFRVGYLDVSQLGLARHPFAEA